MPEPVVCPIHSFTLVCASSPACTVRCTVRGHTHRTQTCDPPTTRILARALPRNRLRILVSFRVSYRTSLHLHQAPSSHAPLVSPRTNLPLLFTLSRRFSLYLPPPRSASPTPLTLIYVPAFRISYPSHSHPRSRVTPTPRRPPHSSNCIPKPLLPRPTPLPHPIPSSPPSNNSESFTLN